MIHSVVRHIVWKCKNPNQCIHTDKQIDKSPIYGHTLIDFECNGQKLQAK